MQVVYKRGRQVVKIRHIGSAHNDAELEILLELAEQAKHEGQLKLDLFVDEDPDLYLERSYSGLLWDSLSEVYGSLGLDTVDDEVFKNLVLARIIEPTSKLDSIRVMEEHGISAPAYTTLCRGLGRIVERGYREQVSRCCADYSGVSQASLVLYDVTTLYFEAQQEDEFRKSGLSKERRLDPQIVVGLLVDEQGFPLEIQSFEGNKAETNTIIPVIDSFVRQHGIAQISVVADAAMLSGKNLTALEELGYHYIVGSRIAKTPYTIGEYLKAEGAALEDMQVFDTELELTISGKRRKRRVVYQYRKKRADLDLRNIDKALAKAEKMVSGKASFKRNRFLKVSGASRQINYGLIEEARRKAGIKGYVTNLDIPARQVIDAYHQLFQVEKSFRMSKSDLRARPMFHHKKESVEAHLTVVFTALAMSRYIEKRTGVSIRKFVREISPIRTGVISVNGATHTVKPRTPESAKGLLASLV